MTKKLALHEGVIRPGLVSELEAYRAPGRRVSSYYLNLDPERWGGVDGIRIAVKNALAEQRERIEQLGAPPAVHHALHRDWDQVQEAARLAAGERGTRALACYVDSAGGYGRALRLPWPVRERAFFEDRFVLWPLHLVLDQSDRYAVCLTDKEVARLFLFYLEQMEEVSDTFDRVPGRVRFPDPFGEPKYMRKHVEEFHHHFAHAAEDALRLFQQHPFQHLIIGGHRETLPQFEGHLHRYLRDRVVARWDIDVHTPLPEIRERAACEERNLLTNEARSVWNTIQDERPARGAVGPEESFAALWQRRVQALLVEPRVRRPGFCCSVCGRLNVNAGPCVECGGPTAEVPDAREEAVHESIEQSGRVYYWDDPALTGAGSVAALRRY